MGGNVEHARPFDGRNDKRLDDLQKIGARHAQRAGDLEQELAALRAELDEARRELKEAHDASGGECAHGEAALDENRELRCIDCEALIGSDAQQVQEGPTISAESPCRHEFYVHVCEGCGFELDLSQEAVGSQPFSHVHGSGQTEVDAS